MQLEQANLKVFDADRATARASFSALTHAETVQAASTLVVDAAREASRSLQAAAKTLPPAKRAVFEKAAQPLTKFAAAASSLTEEHDRAASKLVQSSQAVRMANSAACLAQHGAFAK